jgi:hypothetical protein
VDPSLCKQLSHSPSHGDPVTDFRRPSTPDQLVRPSTGCPRIGRGISASPSRKLSKNYGHPTTLKRAVNNQFQ